MLKERFINACALEFNDFTQEIRNNMIDTIMFNYLVEEDKIPTLIKICNENNVDRFSLIDFVKEEMVELLMEQDQPAMVEEMLEREVEMIPVNFLSERVNLDNKRLILLNIFKKYPSLLNPISDKATNETDYLLCQEFGVIMSCRGSLYEECINS